MLLILSFVLSCNRALHNVVNFFCILGNSEMFEMSITKPEEGFLVTDSVM